MSNPNTSATFYLENINVNELGQCSLKSDQLEFLPVDFGAFRNHLVTDQGVFSEQSDEIITLPLKVPAKNLIPEKSCKIQIENCFFVSNELECLFCEPGENPMSHKGARGSPNADVTGKDGDVCQEKIPELREFLQNISEER